MELGAPSERLGTITFLFDARFWQRVAVRMREDEIIARILILIITLVISWSAFAHDEQYTIGIIGKGNMGSAQTAPRKSAR